MNEARNMGSKSVGNIIAVCFNVVDYSGRNGCRRIEREV
jgi:hypothetical protein